MRHFLLTAIVILYSFASLANKGRTSAPAGGDSANLVKDELIKELTGRDESKKSDLDVYSEVVAAYQTRDVKTMDARTRHLLLRHPASPFADNALYLLGLAAMEEKRFVDALRYFQRVHDEYPNGNKVAAAQFAKAVAYKNMNLPEQARRAFQEVIRRYPGSPESFRADSETRLIR